MSRETLEQRYNLYDPLAKYQIQDGFLIIQLGVSPTFTYEPDGERALAMVADRKDKFLIPAVRVKKR